MSSEVTKRKLCVEKIVNLKLIVVLIIVRHHSEFRQSVSLRTFTGQGGYWIYIHRIYIHIGVNIHRHHRIYNIHTYRGGYTSGYL